MAAGACQRLWALRYHSRLRVTNDTPWRQRGILFHTLAAYGYASQLADPPDWYRSTPLDEALARDGEGAPELIQLARSCFAAYRLHYSSDPIVPLLVEHEFGCRIRDIAPPSLLSDPLLIAHGDSPITCRADLVALINGETWIIDHKTTSALGLSSRRLPKWHANGEYRLSLQAMVNLAVARFCLEGSGLPVVRGFKINRVKIQPPFDFDRHPVMIPGLAYSELALSLCDYADQRARALARLEAGLPAPPSFGSCYGRYGPCDYADVCAAESPGARAAILQMMFSDV